MYLTVNLQLISGPAGVREKNLLFESVVQGRRKEKVDIGGVPFSCIDSGADHDLRTRGTRDVRVFGKLKL